jgi:hypothetical protein
VIVRTASGCGGEVALGVLTAFTSPGKRNRRRSSGVCVSSLTFRREGPVLIAEEGDIAKCDRGVCEGTTSYEPIIPLI